MATIGIEPLERAYNYSRTAPTASAAVASPSTAPAPAPSATFDEEKRGMFSNLIPALGVASALAMPIAPQAPATPALPTGWSTVAPEGWGSSATYNPTAGTTALAGRGNPNPATTFGTANPQGLIDNGFYNVTDFVKSQAGGANIQPMFYNPQTGMWGVWSGQRGGLYQITNSPHLITTVPNESSLGGMLKDAWGNGFGMAMSPFLAGLGGGVETGGATEAGAGGAMDMGGSAGVFDSAGNPLYSSPGMLSSLTPLAKNFGTNLLTSGGNVGAAAKGTALGAGVSYGSNLAATGVNDFMEQFGSSTPPPADVDWRRTQLASNDGMLPLSDAPSTVAQILSTPSMPQQGMLADAGAIPSDTPVFSPNSYMNQPGFLSAPDLDTALQNSKSPVPGDIPQGATIPAGSFQGYNPAGTAIFTPPTMPPAVTPEQQQTKETVSAQQIERVAKLGQELAKVLGSNSSTPEGAPQRQPDQSDQQYVDQLIQYAHLDPQTLAAQGLQPGSPEYYQYVMSQMDSIISQMTESMDLNDPNLADKLRGKTDTELQQLQRALFVRGQMESLVGPGKYSDPFTNIGEDVLSPNGTPFQPDVAAYQRGLARSADTLANLHGTGEAQSFLDALLNRKADLFGLQKNADTRYAEALRDEQQQQEEERRRRGMLGNAYLGM